MKKLERLNLYQVEAIRDSKTDQEVKWIGWEEQFNTWEPFSNLKTVKSLIDAFEKSISSDNRPNHPESHKEVMLKDQDNKLNQHKVVDGAKKKRQKKEVQQAQPGETVVKRGPGRPRKIRTPEQQEKLRNKKPRKKRQTSQPIRIQDKPRHKEAIAVQQKEIRVEGNINQTPRKEDSSSKIDLMSPRSVRISTISKRKYIRKGRTSQRLAEFTKRNERSASQKQEEEQQNKQQENKEKESLQEKFWDEDEQEQDWGIEEVLLKCRNYTQVKVSLKNDTFFYEVPYQESGQPKSIILTAQEIIKVNPKWFEGYFQGFFL